MPLVAIDLLEGRPQAELEPRSVLVENDREDWSFGRGQAGYLELPREEWR